MYTTSTPADITPRWFSCDSLFIRHVSMSALLFQTQM